MKGMRKMPSEHLTALNLGVRDADFVLNGQRVNVEVIKDLVVVQGDPHPA